jgi:hypothetical protein
VTYRDSWRWFFQPWRCDDNGPQRYAREVLANTGDRALPAGAVLIADSTVRRPLDYAQGNDRVRLDVRLLEPRYRWPGQGPKARKDEQALHEYAAEGRLFAAERRAPYVPQWVLDLFDATPYGIVYQLRPAEDETLKPRQEHGTHSGEVR